MNVKYIEKIIVLVNNVWKYDTYIIDSDITENKVKEFILSNDKNIKLKVLDISFMVVLLWELLCLIIMKLKEIMYG